MTIWLVAAGGALGSVARYLLDGAVQRTWPAVFPYGIFLVNMIGCLVFGLLVGAAEQRLVAGSAARAFLLVGLLGGFTTFSSYTFDTFRLLRGADWTLALINSAGQMMVGVLVLAAGVTIGRLIVGAS
jgi:CrcB protein